MTLELSQVHALRKSNSNASVGPLAREGVEYLRASTNEVKISGERIRHIDEEHGGITDFEIITMAYGLSYGLMIEDVKKPNALIIVYLYPDNNIRYKMAIKTANKGTEIWVSTFHRLRQRQTKSLLVRGRIIKKHK